MNVSVVCKRCKGEFVLTVNGTRFIKWKQGIGLIQDMLPELTRDEAELLINGICGPCYDKMFGDWE